MLAEKAAGHAERLGSYLQDADADRLLHDVEELGRKQPLAVVFGGIALGFAASRFLKASSQKRFESPSYTPPSTPTPRTPALPATTGTGASYGATPGTGFPDPVPSTDPYAPSTPSAGGL